MKNPLLLSDNVVTNTYTTIQDTVVQGDVDGLQKAANSMNAGAMNFLLVGLAFVVIIAGIIETGTFFGLILPSDIILSATVLGLVGLGKRRMVALVTVLSIVFTVVGDQLGYYTGYKLGSGLYEREDTWYFKKNYLLKAQEALNKSGKSFLYVGRFVSFGGLLPTIYGMMKRDKKEFFKVSVLSALLWKLSIIVPLVLIVVIFPALRGRIALLLVLAAAVPEIIGWIMLLKPQAEKYLERLVAAKDQINAIRGNIKTIGGNLGEIAQKLKTPTEQQALEAQQQLQISHSALVAPASLSSSPHSMESKIDLTVSPSQSGEELSSTTTPSQEQIASKVVDNTTPQEEVSNEKLTDTLREKTTGIGSFVSSSRQGLQQQSKQQRDSLSKNIQDSAQNFSSQAQLLGEKVKEASSDSLESVKAKLHSTQETAQATFTELESKKAHITNEVGHQLDQSKEILQETKESVGQRTQEFKQSLSTKSSTLKNRLINNVKNISSNIGNSVTSAARGIKSSVTTRASALTKNSQPSPQGEQVGDNHK